MKRNYTYPGLNYLRYHTRERVGQVERIDASVVLDTFIQEQKGNPSIGLPLDGRIRNEEMADKLLAHLNDPGTMLDSKVLSILNRYQEEWLAWQYVRSNLRKGFLFYFSCTYCGQNAKFLYSFEYKLALKCWKCWGLRYPNKRKTTIKRKGASVGVITRPRKPAASTPIYEWS